MITVSLEAVNRRNLGCDRVTQSGDRMRKAQHSVPWESSWETPAAWRATAHLREAPECICTELALQVVHHETCLCPTAYPREDHKIRAGRGLETGRGRERARGQEKPLTTGARDLRTGSNDTYL